jgi:hypothetical protein
MRKLIVNTFMTLDGVMQAPGGPEEDAGITIDLSSASHPSREGSSAWPHWS